MVLLALQEAQDPPEQQGLLAPQVLLVPQDLQEAQDPPEQQGLLAPQVLLDWLRLKGISVRREGTK